MKIGILTHHYVNNFGAFLQAYALRDALAKEYPDDEIVIIDYINIRQFVINTGGWFRFYKDRENLKCWIHKVKVPRAFAIARKRDMVCSPRCYTVKQVNRQNYDVIIIGSDEVWNYQDWKSTDPIKFAKGLACKHIISYAPSVGNSDGEIPSYVKEGLERFFAISVRDDKTFHVVHKTRGISATKVVDPTFLTNLPWEDTSEKHTPYILFYYCDHLPLAVKQQICDHARAKGFAVYGAGECDKIYDAITVDLQPFQWVDFFRNAAFVFTGTFHGAVFSILHHKPFKVYLTNKSRIDKVTDLLRSFDIKDRQIDDKFVFDYEKMRNEIDYELIDARILQEREKGKHFLRTAIDVARNNTEI